MIELTSALRGVPEDESLILGRSPAIGHAIAIARRFALTQLPVLLIGETGTGKELFAQEIHRWSGRRGRLVDINCGGLPRELVEAELFGYRRGAFTGALADADGLMVAAQAGTLFLDELSSLPIDIQPKLLRAIETHEVRRVGDNRSVRVDFRIIAALQQGMGERRDGEAIRPDLFQRVAGGVITLPPLRERTEDIFHLARVFARELGCQLDPAARAILESHHWPGNIRELRSVIDRAWALGGVTEMTVADVALGIEMGCNGLHARPETSSLQTEKLALVQVAKLCNGDALAMAHRLEISLATLYRRLHRFGVRLAQYRARPERRTGRVD